MYQEQKSDPSQGSEQPREKGMRRKNAPDIPASSRKRNVTEPVDNFDDTQSQSSNSGIAMTKEEQVNMMVLSSEARQALIEMQRFDRFIYVMESEKRLKAPIQKELARLERLKNSGNKSMKNSYFDNELTITCLFNHMKNMYEMNRDLGEIVVLKAEIEALQQKIIEQNVKYNKDVKEASTTAKGKFAEESQQFKDMLKIHENIISALKEQQPDRAKKKLEQEYKKAPESMRPLLDLISGLVSKASAETSAGIIDVYSQTLTRITLDQGDVNKNLQYLEKEKKAIEKILADSRTDESKRKALEQLLDTVLYIISIYSMVKGEDRAQGVVKPQKDEAGSVQDRKLLKALEAQVNSYREEGGNWIKQFESLIPKLEADENIGTQINKNRKLLNVKKNMDVTLSNYTQTVLNILDIFNKKARDQTQTLHSDKEKQAQITQLTKSNAVLERDIQQLKESLNAQEKKTKDQSQQMNADKQKSNQIVQLTKANAALQKQIQQLRDSLSTLQKSAKSTKSQPSSQAEWTKLLGMIDQSFKKREANDPTAQSDIAKARKYLQINKKKFPVEIHPVLDTIQYLLDTILDSDQHAKQQETEEQKRQQLEAKDISTLDVFTKTLEKLLTSGDTFNDGFLNKLRKNLETTFAKLQKIQESPPLGMYLGSLNNTWIIVELLTNAHQLSKSKGEGDAKKQDLDNLRDQLKARQLELKNLRQEGPANEKKIKDFERRIEQAEKKEVSQKTSGQEQRKDKQKIQALQRNVQTLTREIDSLKAQNAKELKRKESASNNISNIKEIQKQNSQLRSKIEAMNKSASDSKVDTRQIERFKRQIQQLKNIQNAQQESVSLKNQQIDTLKRRVKQLEKTSKGEVKYVEVKDSNEGAQYWIERYQSSKMENEVLRDQLATLERRFDEIHVSHPPQRITVTRVGDHAAQADLSRIKAQLANQQAIVLSKQLEVQRYQSSQNQYRQMIQSLGQQLRNVQLSLGNNQSQAVQQQLNGLITENQGYKNEIESLKKEILGITQSLVFVDGQNFRINESLKEQQKRSKLFEEKCNTLENNVRSGLQVTKLKDQKIDLENKNEDLRREMDIVVSELQSLKQSKKMKPRMSETPRTSKVISEWNTSNQYLTTQVTTMNQSKSQSSLLTVQVSKDNNYTRIQALEAEKQALIQRLNLLSVFNTVSGTKNLFVDNVNKAVQNVIRFMIDFAGLSEDTLVDSQLLSQMTNDIGRKDFIKYFQHLQQYLRNAVTNLVLHKGSQDQIQPAKKSASKLSNKGGLTEQVRLGELQSLLKLYLRNKDPQLLNDIKDILNS